VSVRKAKPFVHEKHETHEIKTAFFREFRVFRGQFLAVELYLLALPLENLYSLLGVSPSASNEEIRRAYRALAMRYHPDRNPHPTAQMRFAAIKEAHELLSDPQRRAAYNQSLHKRIITDPQAEATALWQSVFTQCELHITPLN
jgi:DnaJ domain